MSDFRRDYDWQTKFYPADREILASSFGVELFDISITGPESEDDRYRNTDAFIRLDGHIKRVSIRIRRYLVSGQFTLRYARPGSLTEWSKVWRGFGDYLLYGRGSDSTLRVEDWFVGSLAVFREWITEHIDAGRQPPHEIITNKDKSSSFVAFSRRDLPAEFTIAEDSEAELREAWWAIVKDGKGMEATGHASAVRWARAGLGLDR